MTLFYEMNNMNYYNVRKMFSKFSNPVSAIVGEHIFTGHVELVL